MTRTAACRCGSLTATCRGEPVRVSVCHYHDCQRRSGSAFATQARFPVADVVVSGDVRVWETVGASGGAARFHFCQTCGSTVWYEHDGMSGLVAVPVGTFADDAFPPPVYSVYETRMKTWLRVVGDGIEHYG